MGRILSRLGSLVLICCILFTGCAKDTGDKWLKQAALDADESVEELYKKAQAEDILIVYTVSTRAVQTLCGDKGFAKPRSGGGGGE